MILPHDRDSLVSVSSLPAPFRSLFKFRYFNAVQSESFPEAYLSDENMVVSAPTGSGKTGIFELCILRLLSRSLTPDGGHFSHLRGSQKIVYIAPMKALVQEISREWKEKFGHILGLVCQELTGDSDILKPSHMQETDIILTTPEKFDSVSRNHRDHGGAGFFGDIALVLIDEVHLLNDSRGASLEAVVSRIKMLGRYPELRASPIARIRFVAASATIPNIEDLAEWLRAPERGIKRFGEEMRPVKLTTKVYGYGAAKNDYLFEKRLQNFLYDVIVQHSSGKPTLVFCCTRKGAVDAALVLSETVSRPGVPNPFIKSQEQFDRLKIASTGAGEKSIQTCILSGGNEFIGFLVDHVTSWQGCQSDRQELNCITSPSSDVRVMDTVVPWLWLIPDRLQFGYCFLAVAYHNGGLSSADRALVEGLFLKCDLQVLCTTSTLAQGVNLPAHLVVIKSTQFYNKEKGRYVEHERSTLLQMCGRAGRPQYHDDSGVVVLMTRNETVHLYENILAGSEPVESKLLPSIAEHLNAEIVLMTVSDVGLAIDWLKCSYLYVRMRKHPEHYKLEKGITEEQMVKHMKGICLQTVNELAKYGMVLMDEYGFTLSPLEPGKLMAKYYLNFETMKTITAIPDHSGIPELLSALAKAQELCWIQLRRHEKKLLNTINQDYSGRMKFHVLGTNGKTKKRIQTYDEKIFLLVNDILSDEPSTLDFTMSQDVNGICTNGARISRCMGDYFKFMKRYKETKNSLLLAKCLRQRLWDDSAHQLKQLPGIGAITVKTFQTAGIDSFEKLASADPRHLEFITGRRIPYGDQVKESLATLPPKVELTVRQTGFRVGGKNEFTLELTRTTQPKTSNKWHMADLIVGDDSENLILFHERIRLDQFGSPYPVGVYSTNSVSAALICEEYVGIDHLNKLADAGTPKAASSMVSTRHQGAQRENQLADASTANAALSMVSTRRQVAQREGKRQSSPIQPPVGALSSSEKDSGTNEKEVRQILELPPVLVNPKFLRDHTLANQKSLMQLARSPMATAAWHVGDGRSGIVGSPDTEIAAKHPETCHRNEISTNSNILDVRSDAETGMNHTSCDSHDYDYDEGFDYVSSHEQIPRFQNTETGHPNFEDSEVLLRPGPSSNFDPAQSSFSDNCSVIISRSPNATGKPEDVVQISGSTSIRNKRHYSSTNGVFDGDFRNENNYIPDSSDGDQCKRRLVLSTVSNRTPLSDLNHVANYVDVSKSGIPAELLKYDGGSSATESATASRPTGFPTSNFTSGRREDANGGCWLFGGSSQRTIRETPPISASSAGLPEHPLDSFEAAHAPVGGRSLFAFLLE